MILLYSLVFILLISACKKDDISIYRDNLVGVWVLREITNNDVTISEFSTEIYLSYLSCNCLSYIGHCFHGTAHYLIDGEDVLVDDLEKTERCSKLSGIITEGSLSGYYELDNNTLYIHSSTGMKLLFQKTRIIDSYNCDFSLRIIDSIGSEKYYQDEIFSEINESLYGKWYAFARYGGWGGGSAPLNFDFLELKRNGIYGFCKGYELFEYGTLGIQKQDSTLLMIEFLPDFISDTIATTYSTSIVEFITRDTIVLYDNCLDCYQVHLCRID